MSERKSEGLSPEKALLMEIALELLGNTVFDVFGTKQNSFIDLFKENAIPAIPNQESPSNTPSSSQQSLLRPWPTRLTKSDMSTATPNSPNASREQFTLNRMVTDDEHDEDDENAAIDRAFVETMMKKIDKEYNNIMKASNKLKQDYFTDYWYQSTNQRSGVFEDIPPEFSEDDLRTITEEYYIRERSKLEELWKEQRDAIILMKKSAATPRESKAVQIVTRNITLVKNNMEKSIQSQNLSKYS